MLTDAKARKLVLSPSMSASTQHWSNALSPCSIGHMPPALAAVNPSSPRSLGSQVHRLTSVVLPAADQCGLDLVSGSSGHHPADFRSPEHVCECEAEGHGEHSAGHRHLHLCAGQFTSSIWIVLAATLTSA